MVRSLCIAACSLFFIASAARSVAALGGGGGGVPVEPRVLDCSYSTPGGGVCRNLTNDCDISGGDCAVGGTDGKNGFHDPPAPGQPTGDGCGCQL